jgi:zinc transport system substrate-binding protein
MRNSIIGSLTLLLTACAQSSDSSQLLTVSIEPERYILQQLAGDKFEIVTLLDNGADPETYEPSMSKRMNVDKSIAYFTVGSLPFEQTITSTLSDKVTVVDTSTGINWLYGTHQDHHADADDHDQMPDPHTWISLKNIRIIAHNMTDGLKKIDEANAATYDSKLTTFLAHIDSLDAAFSQKLSTLPHKSFAIWHPSLSYFARDYQLNQIAVGQESKEISLNSRKKIVETATADSVNVFFYQQEYDPRQINSISQAIGSRLIQINPLNYDIENELTTIVNELTK